MGGNALKNVSTRRYQADEYHAICPEILQKLSVAFPGQRTAVIESYKEKESFGDIDVLIQSDNIKNIRESIQEVFQASEIVHNGTVWSFDYKSLQVDLIMTVSDRFDIGLNYFGHNDLGNLIGRCANKFGLSYGHDGLWMKINDGTYEIGKVLLSTDIKKILDVLGYSYDRYSKGFDTLEDIFEFVVSSPFYTYDIFDFANRNSVSRIRDQKRKTYIEFLKWAVARKEIHNQYKWGKKEEYLQYIFSAFKGTEEIYDEAHKENHKRKLIKRYFNGDHISLLTGLEFKQLGMFMRYIRESHSKIEEFAATEIVNELEFDNLIKEAKITYDKI